MRNILVHWRCFWREHWVLGLMLLLGFANGLIYLFATPPWQHYDEPGHFEFAWLIANREKIPSQGEYDQGLRMELASSMIEHDFFSSPESYPNLLSEEKPIWIGISQISSYPLYHTLISIPLRVLRSSDITLQLYLARLISLSLFLVSIVAAYGIAREMTPPRHPLRWMLPATLALLPSYVNLMTAINDDVGATAFFSLFLWAGIVLIKRGFSWLRLAAVIMTAGLCYFTKVTVSIAVLLLFVPILLGIFRQRQRRIAWVLLGVGVLVAMIWVFGWGDAALWYRNANQPAPTRTRVEDAPFGKNAIHLYAVPGATSQIFQLLPEAVINELRGKTITLGAWMWASERIKAFSPMFFDGNSTSYREIEIGREPIFVAVQAEIPQDTRQPRVILTFKNKTEDAPVSVYFDGIVLAAGKRPLDEEPRFTSASGSRGEWGGRIFNNLLRNTSGENSWPWIRPKADRAIGKYIIGAPSLILGTMLDWPGGNWYYQSTIKNLFYTFWAVFGWGHVRLQPHWFYYLLAAVTMIGAAGALIAVVRRRFHLAWDVVLFLVIATAWMWLAALVRGLGSLVGTVFIPGARYAYPAIIPTVLLLNLGWFEVFRRFRVRQIPNKLTYLPFLLFFLVINALSITRIILFYRS